MPMFTVHCVLTSIKIHTTIAFRNKTAEEREQHVPGDPIYLKFQKLKASFLRKKCYSNEKEQKNKFLICLKRLVLKLSRYKEKAHYVILY